MLDLGFELLLDVGLMVARRFQLCGCARPSQMVRALVDLKLARDQVLRALARIVALPVLSVIRRPLNTVVNPANLPSTLLAI